VALGRIQETLSGGQVAGAAILGLAVALGALCAVVGRTQRLEAKYASGLARVREMMIADARTAREQSVTDQGAHTAVSAHSRCSL
jgi:hypothetical protein